MKTRKLHQRRSTSRNRKPERGFALLVSSLMLILVGAIAISAINLAGQESTAGGQTRATKRNLFAADAGIELARVRLSKSPPDTTAFSFTLEGGRTVESRKRSDGAPQPLSLSGYGPPPEGYEINSGGSSFYNEIFLINITATSANGASTELEAKIAVLQAGN